MGFLPVQSPGSLIKQKFASIDEYRRMHSLRPEHGVLSIPGGLFECEVIDEREVLQEAELSGQADSENDLGGSSEIMYFIGLDVHKKTISYCVKDAAGRVYQEGKVGSSRRELDVWIGTMPQPRMIAMEATIFTGWIYDHLLPHTDKVKVAHPLMLRAIAAPKRKNDRIDAGKIADCLRCDFLPECHMASTEIRDRRRTLRYRSLVVKQMVQMKNRVSGLLMETGVNYNKQRLHKVGYFEELITTNEDVHESIRPLLKPTWAADAHCPGSPKTSKADVKVLQSIEVAEWPWKERCVLLHQFHIPHFESLVSEGFFRRVKKRWAV